MDVIQQAQIGKLRVDVNRRTDEPTYPHGVLQSTNDNTARFSPITLNPNSITVDFTVPSTANASAAGPITLEDGVEFTIEDGASFVII